MDQLIKSFPVVDTHNDFPYLLRAQLHNEIHSHGPFTFDGKLTCHTDLGRLKKGGIGIQFFSCFIECPDDDHLYQEFNKPNSCVRDTLEQIDVITRLVSEYPSHLQFVTSSKRALQSFQETGKISITLGVEGLHQVDASLGVVRKYFELGVRYITLTHNCDNPFATAASSVAGGLPDKGLTDYGRECVKEMNRLGMMVDLSHVSHKTMHDVLDLTACPVIFSHSSAYSVTNHQRNVPDDVLVRVRQNHGVVCVNFYPAFISYNSTATIQDCVDHMKHIIDVAGWECVGLGSDFDGIPHGPKGLEDVSKYPDLLSLLKEQTNATVEQIKMAMGGNVLRVWEDNEKFSEKLHGDKPVEANWPDRKWKFWDDTRDLPEIYPGSKDVYGEMSNKS